MLFPAPLAPTLALPRKQGRESDSFPHSRGKVGMGGNVICLTAGLFTRQLSVVILRGAKRSRRIHKPHGCCDVAQ